jgi:hypothetical protein
VRRLLEDDKVSAKVALDALRRHGEQAGAVLTAKLAGAKNGKLTGASVSKAPPPKVTRRIVSSVDSFVAALSPALSHPCALEAMADDELVTLVVPARALRELVGAHEAAHDAAAPVALKEAA